MAEPYLAEIRIFSFGFPPKGWAMANGQLLAINQNQALFALLGTTYGGDGITTFRLPDLQGRVAMSFNASHPQGQSAGEQNHTLNVQELPPHTHIPNANSALGSQTDPAGNYWANDSNQNTVFGASPNVNLSPTAIANSGSSQPHPNLMPYLVLNFCIALVGIFPSRN